MLTLHHERGKNMKQLYKLIPLALLVGLAFTALPAAGQGSISVTITGIRSQKGVIRCGIYSNPATFPAKATRGFDRAINGSSETCVFKGLAPGKYAIAANHDENKNGKTDTNLVGIPTEGWTVSNNVVPTLRAPRFNEALINLKSGQNVRQVLKLNY